MKRTLVVLLGIIVLLFVGCQSRSNEQVPKNVIFIIGDGCGFEHLQAGSLYLYGEENKLAVHQFPVHLAARTYSASGEGYDPQKVLEDFDYLKIKPTDSAAAGTALSTGSKTYNGIIGLDTLKQPLTHLFELAEKRGKATGVVTSVPFSHATPAAFVAHNESRHNYHAIAHEMIFDSATDVIIGAGHPFYDDDGKKLAEPEYKYIASEDWQAVMAGTAGADANGDGTPDPWSFVQDREDFVNLATGETPLRLLGIATVASTLEADRSGGEEQKVPYDPPFPPNVPALSDLALAALNVLDEDADGFYVMIEAGAIDWASHANYAPRIVEEVAEMEKTVQAVCKWVETNSSWDETLVLFTADHETGYITGPREDLASQKNSTVKYEPLQGHGKGQMPDIEFHSKGHSNSLVPVLAKGVGATGLLKLRNEKDDIRGVYIDNTDIAKFLKSFLQ